MEFLCKSDSQPSEPLNGGPVTYNKDMDRAAQSLGGSINLKFEEETE